MRDVWFVARGEWQSGPVPLDQLKQMAAAGKIRPTDLLLKPGTTEWVRADTVPAIFPAPEPAAMPTVSAAPTTQPSSYLLPALLIGGGAAAVLAVGVVLVVAVWLLRREPESQEAAAAAPEVIIDGAVAPVAPVVSEPRPVPAPPAEAPKARPGSPTTATKTVTAGVPTGVTVAAKKAPDPKPAPAAPMPTPVASEPPVPAGADLDALLRAFSVGVFVGDQKFPQLRDADWSAAMKRFQASREPAVATVVKNSAPVAVYRVWVAQTREKLKGDNDPLFAQLGENLPGAAIGVLEGIGMPDETDIDREVSRGRLDADTARAMREYTSAWRRSTIAAGTAVLEALIKSSLNTKAANLHIRRLRKRAEVLQADLVQDHLLPALRARAGTKQEPPLAVTLGYTYGKDRPLGDEGLLSAVSRASGELTRLTLLFELEDGTGKRAACIYVPRLGPGERLRAEPIVFSSEVMDRPPELKEAPKGRRKARYSVWCDQFQAEGVPLEPASTREAHLAYCIQAAQPGKAYLALNRAGGGRWDYQPVLKFTALKSAPGGYQVGAVVTHNYPKAPSGKFAGRAGPSYAGKGVEEETYVGTMRGVETGAETRPGFLGMVTPTAALVFTLKSAKAALELSVKINEDGDFAWESRSTLGALEGRKWMPAPLVQRSEEEVAASKEKVSVLIEARRLALMHRKDEAKKVLDDFIASKPGPEWEAQARNVLGQLDFLAQQIPQAAFQKQPGTPDLRKTPPPPELNQAVNLLRTGEYAEARKLFEGVIAQHPGTEWESRAKMSLRILDTLPGGKKR